MHLDEYLTRRNLSRASVIDSFINLIGSFREKDTLLFTGSLVEGIGNNQSDIDMYFITDRDISHNFPLTFTNTLIFNVGTTSIDVEFFNFSNIESLLEKLELFPHNIERDFRKTICFSLGDLKLLHNLSIAEFAHGKPELAKPLRKIDRLALSRISFDRSVAHIYSIKTDIVGAICSGDIEVTKYLLSSFYWHLVTALLCINGYTNPSEKWRVKYFDALKKRNIFYDFLSPNAAKNYFNVNSAVEIDRDFLRFFKQISYISNILIPHGQFRFATDTLISSPISPASNSSEDKPALSDSDVPLPLLRQDVVVRYSNKGFLISGNQSKSAQYLNKAAFDILSYFDGVTSIKTATSILKNILNLEEQETKTQISHFYNFLHHNHYI